jgi:septum formation protein
MKVILASASPRRKELLQLIGIVPQIAIPLLDETRLDNEALIEYLQRLAIGKGQSVYRPEWADHLIISADTVVVLDNEVIGKPRDRQDALSVLRKLSGRTHCVYTGIALTINGNSHYACEKTEVTFCKLDDSLLNFYLDHEHYMDKAGAYAIQGKASLFVEKINGCYFNVMGFPIHLFFTMANQLNLNIETLIQ